MIWSFRTATALTSGSIATFFVNRAIIRRRRSRTTRYKIKTMTAGPMSSPHRTWVAIRTAAAMRKIPMRMIHFPL